MSHFLKDNIGGKNAEWPENSQTNADQIYTTQRNDDDKFHELLEALCGPDCTFDVNNTESTEHFAEQPQLQLHSSISSATTESKIANHSWALVVTENNQSNTPATVPSTVSAEVATGNNQSDTPATVPSTEVANGNIQPNSSAAVQIRVSRGINRNGPSSYRKKRSLEKRIIPAEGTGNVSGYKTSKYRGVSKHKLTGRYEAHLWDNNFIKEGQNRRGKQVYLGGYDSEIQAARSYDKAALKYWGDSCRTNFPKTDYEEEIDFMKQMTTGEYISYIKRWSSGFTRGASKYRGVTRHRQRDGRWQARIGRIGGEKGAYLGVYSTEEEAGLAYDIASIKFGGSDPLTNFEKRSYDVKSIKSSTLSIGEQVKYNKEAVLGHVDAPRIEHSNTMISQGSTVSYSYDAESTAANEWPALSFDHQANQLVAVPLSAQSGLWLKPADDMQTLASCQSHLGQSMLTSSSHSAMQNKMGLGTEIINEGNNTGSAAGIHTNLSDIFEANSMVFSNSSSFANSSAISVCPFRNKPNGLFFPNKSVEEMMSSDFWERNLTFLTPQAQSSEPAKDENQNFTHNSLMAEVLQAFPPEPNLSNGPDSMFPPRWNRK